MINDSKKLELDSILFDMDDVLVNVEEATNVSWERALRGRIAEIPEDELKKTIKFIRSGKAEDMVAQVLLQYSLYSHDPMKIVSAYKEAFLRLPEKIFNAYNGVVNAVRELYERGFRLAIVTNRLEDLALYILQCIGLHEIFPRDRVVCGNEVRQQKPHREPLDLAIKRFEINPQYTGLVEDDISTLKTAREMGFKTIHIGPRSSIRVGVYPDITLPSVAYLPQYLKRWSSV